MRPLAEIAADLQRIAAELVEPPPLPFTVVGPGESIQAVLDDVPAGREVRLVRGATYPGNLVIRKPVTLRTAGIEDMGDGRITPTLAPWLARLVPTNGSPLIDIVPGTEDVTLSRLWCEPANLNDVITIGHADGSQVTREQQPRRIALSQIYAQASETETPKRGIALHGDTVGIRACHLAGFKRAQDTQAICGWNGSGIYRIFDNYLEAAGMPFMFGGADPTIAGLVPDDIVIEGNALTKDMAWRGTNYVVKNLGELKAARNVTLRGNELSNNWHSSAQAGQNGYALMFTVQSQDGRNPNVIVENVLVERNVIRNVGAGVNLMGKPQIHPTVGQQSRNFTFRNNWWQIDAALGTQAWWLFLSREPREIAIANETVYTNGTNALLKHEGAAVQAFALHRSLFTKSGTYGFTGNISGVATHRAQGIDLYLPGGGVRENVFGGFPSPQNLPNNVHMATAAITVDDGYGTGACEGYGRTRP